MARIFLVLVFVFLFDVVGAKIRNIEAYRKRLEGTLVRLSSVVKNKYPADTDPFDPGIPPNLSGWKKYL